MKNRHEKIGYGIIWGIDSGGHLPDFDVSCCLYDSDPKLFKGMYFSPLYV